MMEREALHRRLELLYGKLDKARFYIAPRLVVDFQIGLLNVHIGADGLVDPASVDRCIRSILMFIPYLGEHDEWNDTVSLGQIQEAYFQRIDRLSSETDAMMRQAEVNPDELSVRLTAQPKHLEETVRRLDAFVADIEELWEYVPQGAWADMNESLEHRRVYAAERLPDEPAMISESAGREFDIAVLPDPFVTRAAGPRQIDQGRRCVEILQCVLKVLPYRGLARSDERVPKVAILPGDCFRNDGTLKAHGDHDKC